MRLLSSNEIGRTAYRYNGEIKPSAFGYTHPELDKNYMCPSCKNENTDAIIDDYYLKPFRDFYGERKFKAINCHCCGAMFSVFFDKGKPC